MNQRFEILAPVESIHGRRRYLGRRKQGPGVSRLVLLTRLPRRLSTDPVYLAELGVLTSFRHRSVAAVLELQSLAGELFLTHELCAGASLSELVLGFSKRGGGFPPGLIGRILYDVAIAIDDAHHFRGPLGEPRPVSHRELSLHSVVLSYEGVTKIVDFGHPRPPQSTVDAMKTDLEGLGRLIELSGAEQIFGKLLDTLRPDAQGNLPRPRRFAEEIEKAAGEALWSEDAVAQFVRTQFPRRMERLQRLAVAEAVWAPPEMGPVRSRRPAEAASIENTETSNELPQGGDALAEDTHPSLPPAVARATARPPAPPPKPAVPVLSPSPRAAVIALADGAVGPGISKASDLASAATVVRRRLPALGAEPPSVAPGTEWLSRNGRAMLGGALVVAIAALLVVSERVKAHHESAVAQAARPTVTEPASLAARKAARHLLQSTPWTTNEKRVAFAGCDIDAGAYLERLGFSREMLLEPLVLPENALTKYEPKPEGRRPVRTANRRLR